MQLKAVVLLTVALTLTSCASTPPDRPAVGHAIQGSGPAAVGFFGITEPRPDQEYWFAYPFMTNLSKKAIELTGYSITTPADIQVTGWFIYSLRDTHNHIYYDWRVGDTEQGFDLTKQRNYSGRNLRVMAKGHSPYVVMVKVRIPAAKFSQAQKHPPNITACFVNYTQSGKRYREKFDCDYRLGQTT